MFVGESDNVGTPTTPAEIAAGRLQALLEGFAAPPNGIFAVFPHARHLPLRVRLWIDFLKQTYGSAAYWGA